MYRARDAAPGFSAARASRVSWDWGMAWRVWSASWFRRAFTARWPMSLWVYQYSRAPNTGSRAITRSQVSFAVGSMALPSRQRTMMAVKMAVPPRIWGRNASNHWKILKSTAYHIILVLITAYAWIRIHSP